jgi:hypothetical protein
LRQEKGKKMTEPENFIRARDNEADENLLGTEWERFRYFRPLEETEHNVRVYAELHNSGLPQDGKPRTYSAEWLLKDDNLRDVYAPLRDEPGLFVEFADLASKDPGTKDGRYHIMLDWIKRDGVLGLTPEGNTGQRSRRHENLFLFWDEVRDAATCKALYEAATGPGRLLKRSSLHGKTLSEKRKSALQLLGSKVGHILKRDCYPKLYYQEVREQREDTGEIAGFALSWGFHSLLGAMYLQLAWRIKSRQCEAPGCNNIIRLHERSNKATCSRRCKERRRYHCLKAKTE